MLSQRFTEVWVIGGVDEADSELLKQALITALTKGSRRIKFKFYLPNPGDLGYMEAMRPVLLENVVASIVVEEKPLEELERDLETVGEEVIVVSGREGRSILDSLEKLKSQVKVISR